MEYIAHSIEVDIHPRFAVWIPITVIRSTNAVDEGVQSYPRAEAGTRGLDSTGNRTTRGATDWSIIALRSACWRCRVRRLKSLSPT